MSRRACHHVPSYGVSQSLSRLMVMGVDSEMYYFFTERLRKDVNFLQKKKRSRTLRLRREKGFALNFRTLGIRPKSV